MKNMENNEKNRKSLETPVKISLVCYVIIGIIFAVLSVVMFNREIGVFEKIIYPLSSIDALSRSKDLVAGPEQALPLMSK